MKKFMLGISVGFVILAKTAAAQTTPLASEIPGGGLFMTGQRLADLCEGKTGADQPLACLGYVNGVAEALFLYKVICYNHITRGDLSDTVVKYMTTHPEEIRRHTALVLTGIALKAAYPVTPSCVEQTK